MRLLVRPSLLLVIAALAALAVCVAPLSGSAASPAKGSLSAWTKAKQAKVLTPSKVPAKIPGPAKTPPPPPPAAAGAKSKGKPDGKSDGPPVSGKVAVFGFTGDGAARVQQAVISTLRTRGLHVTTGLRPVDSAEQYRDMAAALRLAAYIDGSVDGAGSQATVHVRSGMTGRRIASVRFSGEGGALPSDVGNNLWPRTGGQLSRLCAEAAKPRKGGGRVMRINAGTPLENTVRDDSDVPRHLRTGRRRDDPWADEGT